MKTNQEHFIKNQQGIGLVYVLVAIGLFAALSFTLTRLNDTEEASMISPEQSRLYANQLINYTAQAKSSIDQMTFSNTEITEILFDRPGQAGFNSNEIDQLHHPDGGGLTVPALPERVLGSATSPASGWYFGRFNNTEWTPSSNNDIMLVAYDIPQSVCSAINEIAIGDETIPSISDTGRAVFINTVYHSTTNENLTPSNCSDCEGHSALCVKSSDNIHIFYSILSPL